MGISKVLIIGGTGSIGKYVVKASTHLGHPTFVLVRTTAPNSPEKAQLLKAFQESGARLLVGDVTDHGSLVAALKQVDVVVSTVGVDQIANQIKILDAAKEAGTIKRFLPSEFIYGIDTVNFDDGHLLLLKNAVRERQAVRRAVEKSGVPYTYIAAYCFANFFLAPLLQYPRFREPPRDGTVAIFGDGTAKAIFNDEVDIGTFTMRAVDDERAENKVLHIIPKQNVASQNEVTALWEKKIGHTFEREVESEEKFLREMREPLVPHDYLPRFMLEIKYSNFVIANQTRYPLDPAKDVEATELYPDVKYTTIDEFLSRFV